MIHLKIQLFNGKFQNRELGHVCAWNAELESIRSGTVLVLYIQYRYQVQV